METEIVLNPKNVTFNISQKDQWFITKETFEEALGGEEFIKKDPRLANMIWQTEFLLGNRIEIQDFIYIMHYTDTSGQQLRQIDRVTRFINAR